MADTLITGTTLVEKESRSIGDVPIGGIVSWAKTLSGVPNLAEGWVECDGSVLVDALSPLNGQTIPDLNGGVFMRGDTTSGGTGGSTTHTHSLETDQETGLTAQGQYIGKTGTDNSLLDVYDGGGASTVEVLLGKTAGASVSTEPPYYNIVWIMRVR